MRGGADAVVGAGVVVAWVVVVAVVHRGAPVGGCGACEDGLERAALQVGGDLQACVVEERGGEVGVEREGVCDSARLHARAADEEWDAQAGLVHEALVEESHVAEEEAVICGVKDERVFGEAVLFEVVEDAPHAVVHALHAGEVVLHVALVFVASEVVAGERFHGAVGLFDFEFGGHFGVEGELEVAVVEVVGDGLFVGRQSAGAGVVFVEERGWLGEGFLCKFLAVFLARRPVSVRGFLVKEEEERLVLRARGEEL